MSSTILSSLAYLNHEKKRLILELGERIEDLNAKKRAIENNILDRAHVDTYPEFQNYLAFINTEIELLRKHMESIENWNISHPGEVA